ncbi:MAG TPA: YceI family protein [Verrucomicrobiaceae bacterium]
MAARAAFAGDTATSWKGSSVIEFSGTSTLHNWSGKVPAEPFAATVLMGENDRPQKLKASVEVKAAKMDTGEAKRDENMRKDMKVKSYPLIEGTINTSFDKVMPDGGAPAKLPFTLSILGKPQPVEARISHWRLKGDVATFEIDFELSLAKCGIHVPAVLLVISVGDVIKLHAPVRLVRADSQAIRP